MNQDKKKKKKKVANEAMLKSVDKYTTYSTDFLSWLKQNEKKFGAKRPPKVSSKSGQIVALLTDEKHRNLYFSRNLLEFFLNKINMKSKDAIQLINKSEQYGLKNDRPTIDGELHYAVPHPFTFISTHITARSGSIDRSNQNKCVQRLKQWITQNYIEVPNHKWQSGHRDPLLNVSDNNIVWQPPIQARFRDNYKFDEQGLTKWPTVKYLIQDFDRFYPSDDEKITLYKYLADTPAVKGSLP